MQGKAFHSKLTVVSLVSDTYIVGWGSQTLPKEDLTEVLNWVAVFNYFTLFKSIIDLTEVKPEMILVLLIGIETHYNLLWIVIWYNGLNRVQLVHMDKHFRLQSTQIRLIIIVNN